MLFSKTNQNSCVRKYDISNFYPSITTAKLTNIIKKTIKYPVALNLLKSVLNTPTVSRGTKKRNYPTIKIEGIPQGLSVSNILAEIYMMGFDKEISRLPVNYWRYVDDILIISTEDYSDRVHNAINRSSSTLDLNCDNDKFKICSVDKKFDYLGYSLSNKSISVRQASFESHIQKIVDIFRWYQKNKNDPKIDSIVLKNALIDSVNERITGAINDNKKYGWLFYFSEISDKTILYKIDSIVKKKFKR